MDSFHPVVDDSEVCLRLNMTSRLKYSYVRHMSVKLENGEADLEKLRSVRNPILNLLDYFRIIAAEDNAEQVPPMLETFGESLQFLQIPGFSFTSELG